MSVYLIFSYDITDEEGYSSYAPSVIPFFKKYDAEVLIADYKAKAIEGTARGAYVVVKFDSEEKALAMYNDPEYNPTVRAIRFENTAERTAVLVKEFDPSTMK